MMFSNRRVHRFLPSIEFGLPESDHEEGHLKSGQSQDDLPREKQHRTFINVH